MISYFAQITISGEGIAACVSVIAAMSAWMVIPWRVAQVEKRIDRLENSERQHSERLAHIETDVKNIAEICARIADKLNVE